MRIELNENFEKLSKNYLFSEIAKRVAAFKKERPDMKIIRMGIGDVTLPLPATVVEAMKSAADEMGRKESFRGYPPEYGYDFLRERISEHYRSFGVEIPAENIFVSDGAKSDCGNIVDILGGNEIYMPDPVYPVYMDSNVMSGNRVHLLKSNKENSFLPMPDENCGTGVYYLCSPNNPTGSAYSKEQLEKWVAFALKTGSLIIYDAAYEAFVTDGSPRSIFCVEGAGQCAVEICSFSKTCGFTGTRCGYTVISDKAEAGGVKLRDLWMRRQATKFNGVSYPVQRAAEAAYSDEGIKSCMENIAYYRKNAEIISDFLDRKKIYYTGGKNSPYIWLECGMNSWDFFDKLLYGIGVVGTPGAGFGKCGEGFFRLTAFSSREDTIEAVKRMEDFL